MREAEFRSWLNQRRYQGKGLTTVNQRVNWCRAVERALPELGFADHDLDAIHAQGNWDSLLSAVSKLRSNWRNNEAAARVIAPQSDNPRGQMANARSSIGLYGRFANGDDPNYDEVPDNPGGTLTDAEIAARFARKPSFAAWHSGWSQADRDAFVHLARLLHNAGLDWYHVNIDRQVRCGRKKIGAIDATEVFATVSNLEPRCWVRKPADRASLGLPEEAVSMAELIDVIEAAPETLSRFSGGTAFWPDQVAPDPAQPEAGSSGEVAGGGAESTNLILYGPPGTGKTYATAAEAVRLCDGIDTNEPLLRDSERRADLRRRYDQLVDAGQVRMVTFHQNYSYEEFVEGLRPVTDGGPDGDDVTQVAGFRLEPRRGIFREICAVAENARKNAGRSGGFDLNGRKLFKMSLGRAGVDEHIFDAAIEGGYAVLGWGGDVDWSEPRYEQWPAVLARWQQEKPDATGNDPNVVQLWSFRSAMQAGDLIIVSAGNSHFRAIGEVIGPYRFESTDTRDYNHRRAVRWLLVPDEPLPTEMIYGKRFMMQSCYQLKDALVNKDALSRLLPGSTDGGGRPDQFVLIIDEINRANISKVFGELITLIEPDKRLGGGREALAVKLPYSGETFGVPANLHIVGTMNTADRSIALLDTALRRRFVFREVAPDPSLLREDVDGVPLRQVLQTINDRIEYLIDREHRIGHAFFIGEGGKDRKAIDAAMRDKVIPLLQEYFFEDWSRVAAVLGEPQGKGGGFLDCRKLRDPTGQDGEERESWSVRRVFSPDAYDRLVGKAAPATPASEPEESLDEAAE
jgi:hypothetical protein